MVGTEFLETVDAGFSIGLASPTPEVLLTPNIGVMGVGGAGGNAVNNMIESGLGGISFFVANTDAQALSKSLASDRIQLGVTITQGLGAGSKPEVGQASAEESAEKIKESLAGLHLLFITAGMGGGTGTGAAPVVARIARDMGILTVGVVSKPFRLEGVRRMRTAEAGILELQKYVDTLIVIPNQNLFRIAAENTTFGEAFKMVDDVLYKGVKSITDLVLTPGLINLDFADLKTVISSMGRAMMGTGEAGGDNRALIAAEKAITNPLLDDASMKGAKSILINISGGSDLTLMEVDAATERIRSELPDEANIIFGACTDETLNGKIRVSLVATGIDQDRSKDLPVEPQPPVVEQVEPQSVLPQRAEPEQEPAEQFVQEELIKVSAIVSEKPAVEGMIEHPQLDVQIETVQTHVVSEPPLFEDEVPVIPAPVPVSMVPDIEPPIDLEGKKSDANVKTTHSSLFDIVPGLMGKSYRKSKKEAAQKKEIPTIIMDEEFDKLPDFLRRK